MIYRDSDDPGLRARRARMIAEFRLALRRIERDFPETNVAPIAGDLLLAEPAVELTGEEASARVTRADAGVAVAVVLGRRVP